MTLALTPVVLAAAWDYLRTTNPFNRWRLPPADEVEFHVTRHRDREGDHTVYCRSTNHIVRASSHHIKTTNGLMELLAHEMIHAYQALKRTWTRADHNAEFNRLARLVCKHHGWDKRLFLD